MKKARTMVATGAAALALILGTVPALAKADPATTVWQAEGSNMGICSAFLGGLQVRDDVNRIIAEYGDALGFDSPGTLYRVRARQTDSKAPAAECLQRQLPQ